MQVTILTQVGEGAEAGVEVPGRPQQVTRILEGPRWLYGYEKDTGPTIRLSNGVEVCATRDHLRWRVIRVTAGAGKVTHPAELDIGSLLGPGWDENHHLRLVETEKGFLLEDLIHEQKLHFSLEKADEGNMEFVVEDEDQVHGGQLQGQFFRYDAGNGKLVPRSKRQEQLPPLSPR